MDKINLIIHGTLTPKGDEIVFGKKIEQQGETLRDERSKIPKKNINSNVFSLYQDAGNRVYSLINSKIIDFERRSGFYAIRLFVSPEYKISNPKEVLLKIKERFDKYRENDNFSNQDYDDILLTVQPEKINNNIFIGSIIDDNFYEFTEANKIDNLLNNEDLLSVKRLYVFDKSDSNIEQSAKDLKLKPIKEIKEGIRRIKFYNPRQYLTGVYVNDNPINYKRSNDFTVLCKKEDIVEYKVEWSNKKLLAENDDIEVERPEEQQKEPSQTTNYILFSIIGLLLGAAGGYFIPQFFKGPAEEPPVIIESVPEQTIDFKLDGSVKDITFKIENINELSAYSFKLDSKGDWMYNSGPGAKDSLLDQQVIKKIISDPIQAEKVITAIQNFAGKEIKDKTETKKDDKNSIEAKGQEAESSSSEINKNNDDKELSSKKNKSNSTDNSRNKQNSDEKNQTNKKETSPKQKSDQKPKSKKVESSTKETTQKKNEGEDKNADY